MGKRVVEGRLSIAEELHSFVRDEALPGTGVDEAEFWAGADRLIHDLAPQVRAALAERARLQAEIDAYGRKHRAQPDDPQEYADFLHSIGYLSPEPEDLSISTRDIDPEISHQPGPQLVVPVSNARFAINAANARWGSLYDALYGTDVIDETEGRSRDGAYNPVRGQTVIARGRVFLDEHLPLQHGSHADVTSYRIEDGQLHARLGDEDTGLREPAQLVGHTGAPDHPASIVLIHHGLHVELRFDRTHPVGSSDKAGISDVVLESAVTTIVDLEDSVAAVDAADKVACYRNWLGLVRGTLTCEMTKDGKTFVRRLRDNRRFTAPDGADVTLPGTSLLFVRHVGHLMTTDAIVDADGNEVPEGIVDSLVTTLCSLTDLRGPAAGRNSRYGSMYVVKPKLHGPTEVGLAIEIFARTEEILGLPPRTVKIGIMDEERRTSLTLGACIHAARDRVAFVNTGFLDRTGDEIRTSTVGGPMVPKAAMRNQPWFSAYEDRNVDVALRAGFRGRAQIGKGMWAAPDNLADMLEQKIAHPLAGATCAWVPSPTAATLHALHYHAVDVLARQEELLAQDRRTPLDDLLKVPFGDPSEWSTPARREELDNNVQSALGYVVRWINAGVGCSKVPDIHGTALMEDRATCRISSQMVANWLLHDVISTDDVEQSLRRMALVVDEQNAGDPTYEPMAPGYDGPAFNAARELLLTAVDQPSGYTEPVLHHWRLIRKTA